MGKKKWCFGREDFVCLTKDCPYMAECIQVVWEKKVSRMISRMRPSRVPASVAPDDAEHPAPAASPARRRK